MKAVVLAGGCGTRLRPLTYTTPKPMLPLLGKPILHHIVENLAAQGFDEIIITTNYLRDQVLTYFGEGSAFGVKIIYPMENTPLGTAGSVKNADEHLDETFVVIQGDGVTDISIKDLVRFHEETGGIATLALTSVDNPSEYGVVEVDRNDMIVRFKEKPRPDERFSNLANTGIYVLEPEVLDCMPAEREYDFSRDLFPNLLARGETLYGHIATGFWVDIGRPEKYMEAIRWALGRSHGKLVDRFGELRNCDQMNRASIGETAAIASEALSDGFVMLLDGCYIGNGAIIDGFSVLEKDVKIADRARITNSIVYHGSDIGTCSHINGSIIAEECTIGSYVDIEASVVGAGCKVGNNAMLQPGSKIWPKIEVNPHSTIRGIMYPQR